MVNKFTDNVIVVHIGGKIMHHSKTLKACSLFSISLILGFVSVTFGCATSKNQISSKDFEITAEAVSEGILLTFNDIPADAVRMTIFVSYFTDEENPNSNNHISSMADLRDASFLSGRVQIPQLDKVKQTRKVIFPITQSGQQYHISATVWNERDHQAYLNDENFQPISAATECLAENGTYFNSDALYLKLDDNNTVATLSSEPVFTSDIVFDTQKYSYWVSIDVPEKGSIGVASFHIPDGLSSDGLTWIFEPYMTADIKKDIPDGWLEKGNSYTAYVEANANIIYDDVSWFIEIAQSPEFTYIYN
jgi:hypothetical protein